jgi:hypothetical protein
VAGKQRSTTKPKSHLIACFSQTVVHKQKDMRNKSLEQLERDNSKEPKQFSNFLVKKAYEFRKKPLQDLTIEEIRLLISQSIGLEHIVPLALDKLDEDILAEGDFYKGDLLIPLSKLPNKFWDSNATLLTNLKVKVEKNSDYIKSEMGEKELNRIKERLK